jgi:hypothetical protein
LKETEVQGMKAPEKGSTENAKRGGKRERKNKNEE